MDALVRRNPFALFVVTACCLSLRSCAMRFTPAPGVMCEVGKVFFKNPPKACTVFGEHACKAPGKFAFEVVANCWTVAQRLKSVTI